MSKMKALAAVIMSALLVDGAMAAEFAKEMSPTTVELMEKAGAEKATATARSKSPRIQANDWIKAAGLTIGHNSEKGVFIAIGNDSIDVKKVRQLSNARAVGTMTAQLKAKTEIAKYLNTEATAEVLYLCPPKTKKTEFDIAKEELEEALKTLTAEYKEALAAVDQEKANQIGDISMDELFKEGLSVSLKKCGVDLDFQMLQAKSKQKLDDLKNQVKALEGQLEEIKKQAQALAESLNSERTSEARLMADMIVSGAVVVNSWERYENNTYEVAVVVVWSPAQERFVRSVLGMNTEPVNLKPTSQKSRAEYVNGIKWEHVAGTRWFVDRDGTPHLFGVGIEELRDDKSSTLERAEIMADNDAWQNLAMALIADTKFQQETYRKLQDMNDAEGNSVQVDATSAARAMQGAVKELKLRGVSTVFDGICPSPITDRNVYVKVVHLNPLSMRSALKMFNSQIDTARDVGKSQQEVKGFTDQSMASVQEARNAAASYTQGVQQANATAEELAKAKAAEQAARNTAHENRHAPTDTKARVRGGTFGGAGAEDFSF